MLYFTAMKEKIKELLQFLVRGWRGGLRGKIGVVCAVFACVMFVRLFMGQVSVQQFVMNIWRLGAEQEQLVAEQQKLVRIEHSINLLQTHSADYVEELSHKYLNMGAPELRILK
jgi:cell division protein FtsB